MARLRTIKPEFWTDERVGECSPTARLVFIASWNFADDYGGIDRSAKQLKAQAFPYDTIEVEPLIQELIRVGLFVEYEANGKRYVHINGFQKHQKIEKPSRPRIPRYDSTVKSQGTLTESSPTSSGSSLGSCSLVIGSKTRARATQPKAAHQPKADKLAPPTSEARRQAPLSDDSAWVEFQSLQELYPPGTYRAVAWQGAERNFRKLRETEPIETLVKAVQGYAAQQEAMGKVGSQFVLSPEKFFSGNNWRGPFPLPTAPASNGAAKASAEAQASWAKMVSTSGEERTEHEQRALVLIGGYQRIRLRTDASTAQIRREYFTAFETTREGKAP